MNGEIQEQQKQIVRPKPVVVILLGFISVMLLAITFFSYSILTDTHVHKGISINGVYVGGLTHKEMLAALDSALKGKLNNTQIQVKAGTYSDKLSYKDIDAAYDINNAADKAFEVGRSGDIFTNLYNIFIATVEGMDIKPGVIYDKKKLDAFVENFYKKTRVEVKEPGALITDSLVTIQSGHKGISYDKDKLVKQIVYFLNKCMNGNIELQPAITEQGKLSVDDLYKEINREAANASFSLENGSIKVIPHVSGRSVDKAALADAVNKTLSGEDGIASVPVISTVPEITTELANQKLFADTLAKASTRFASSNENEINRGENIRIAASKINGLILLPGDVFSFNGVVGPRTEDGGFKVAHTYVAGKIVDGIGGGICQVSSTLYKSVLFSDLEVVERRNHMFTVSYAFGLDATVSYGDVDFKFRNSTRWPIKIEASVSKSNYINFALKGTNETPGKVVELTPKTIKTVDFKIKYIDDPALPVGKTEVKQKGMKGYVVETYKTIKQDGKVISQVKLHTSTYKALDEEIRRGTKKIAAPAPAPAAAETAPPVSTGVDDADNPPAE